MSPMPTARWVKLVSLAAIIALPSAFAMSYVISWYRAPSEDETAEGHTMPPGAVMNTPFVVMGIRTPTALRAHEADLEDDEGVIGVVVQGKHRAYRLRAMTGVGGHVINDLLERVPATVTYDDRNDFARVFTTEERGKPLDIDTGGYFNGLILRIDGHFFEQHSGKYQAPSDADRPALPTLPHTRTTWKKWRDAYPDTDVYAGRRPASKAQTRAQLKP